MGTMHDPIRFGTKEGRALKDECEYIEEFFPSFAHCKHFMRCIAMKKKCLCEKRQVPVGEKEYQDDHLICCCVIQSKTLILHCERKKIIPGAENDHCL
jgi:hypothetical protein